jgi:hypothetical protein
MIMTKTILRLLALGSAMTAALPASAGDFITSVQIKNVYGVAGQGWLQLGEVQLIGGGTNYALAGIASATSVHGGNGPSLPGFANDGDLSGAYPNIYHGGASDGSDIFTLTLAGPALIDTLNIYGRTDASGSFRDIYSYTLFNGDVAVQSGILDATGPGWFASAAVTEAPGATAVSGVPEPATWAMMIMGFGAIGAGMRRRNATTRIQFA